MIRALLAYLAFGITTYFAIGVWVGIYWLLVKQLREFFRNPDAMPFWYLPAQLVFIWFTWPRIFSGKLGFRYGNLNI